MCKNLDNERKLEFLKLALNSTKARTEYNPREGVLELQRNAKCLDEKMRPKHSRRQKTNYKSNSVDSVDRYSIINVGNPFYDTTLWLAVTVKEPDAEIVEVDFNDDEFDT